MVSLKWFKKTSRQKTATGRPEKMEKLFFLHIPKCAGMSVLEVVKQVVPRNQLYQSTSMIVNWFENYPEFFEHSSFSKLRILFGHWLHEDMLKIVPGNFLLATEQTHKSQSPF
jgi:hypothetical protein